MKKILMIVSMNLTVLTLCAKTTKFNWNPVMDAIIQVESEGNPNAVSGNSVGAMQITPILVKDCNDILKKLSESKTAIARIFGLGKSSKNKPGPLLEHARNLYDNLSKLVNDDEF